MRVMRWSRALAVAAVALTVGIGSAVVSSAPVSATESHAEIAYDYLVNQGLSSIQASGVVGNLEQESGVGIDPTDRQSGGPGMGIAQWSIGGRWDTDYHDNDVWYAGT